MATCAEIGLKFNGDDGLPVEAEERANEYLAKFDHFDGGKCRCGRSLGGLLGSFTWGIVHGDGFCGACRWPARAYHTIDLGDLGSLELTEILPYAEALVTAVQS